MDRQTTSDADQAYLPTADSNHRDREFILMNKIAHGGSYPGRDDDLATMITSGNIRKAAALPSSGKQESGVPPRASPVAPQKIAVPATAASKGVAPLDSTTQEVDAPPVAPLAPMQQEEPLVSLVDAPSCAGDIPAVWTGAKTAQEATEMEVIDLPDANLAEAIAEAESRDADHDDARAPRKRRAVTHDDSDTHSSTSDSARPRKKAPRASRAAAAAAGRAGASAAKAPHPTRTQQPTATVAAARQPDEDGFVAPPRRHTAKAAALQPPQPLPTTNAFAGANVDEMEDDEAPLAPPQRKPPPPPPIVVQWDGEYRNFEQKLVRGAGTSSEAEVLLLERCTLPPASLPPPRAGYSARAITMESYSRRLRLPRLRPRGQQLSWPRLTRGLPVHAGVAGAQGVPPVPQRNRLSPTLRRSSGNQPALRHGCSRTLSPRGSQRHQRGPSQPPLWRRSPQRHPASPLHQKQQLSSDRFCDR
ncbi:uncharacterized protein LOC126443575 [Schistocerca serialis cubense]|uniref:uncharacterized protein LOC126443575 n=1 Tax=Schistocerca serialis cubense TaxID=2023355 RepID=UPI00214EEF62|nr:uncharacterized protein LOC126443575 [Schistocerca serialis cubense]